jgi:MOSC domain-containing protein YiiM
LINGIVEGIYIAPKPGVPTVLVNQAHVVPGKGIEGDRYYREPGTSDKPVNPGREITLIEIEAIQSMRDEGINITPDKTRRNIITRGIALNDLVGCSFYIGNIQLRGVRLCEPCNTLASQTDRRIFPAMVHRGGLRAEIITEGNIHINDIILTSEKE